MDKYIIVAIILGILIVGAIGAFALLPNGQGNNASTSYAGLSNPNSQASSSNQPNPGNGAAQDMVGGC